jgi:hypothetical protein
MSQDEIRKELLNYMEIHPLGMLELASLININHLTLKKFVRGQKVRVDTWKKLEAYVKNESRQ